MTMREVCGFSLSFTQQIMASRAFRILQQRKQQQLLNRCIHIKIRARAFEFLLPEHLSSKLVQVLFETCKTHHLTKWLLVEALFRHFLPPTT
jgi:hypothetical protein